MEYAESGEEALEIAAELRAQGRELGLVISDFMMPGLRGDELLVRLHALSPNTVKILLTGQSDLSGVKRAINEANLYRFLEKPFLNEDVVLTVRAAIRRISRNRRKLDQVLEEELTRERRYGTGFSLVMMDIDHFKRVNDQHGHAAGDAVLATMAGILQRRTRESDALGRLGGEEFVIVCRHSALEGCLATANKIREEIAGHDFPGVGLVTASFGATAYQPGDDAAQLLARADTALYRAKAAGRNRVESIP